MCGTDGNKYPSHCELHRAACVRGHPIAVDHSGKSCVNKQQNNNQKKDRKTKLDKSRVRPSSKSFICFFSDQFRHKCIVKTRILPLVIRSGNSVSHSYVDGKVQKRHNDRVVLGDVCFCQNLIENYVVALRIEASPLYLTLRNGRCVCFIHASSITSSPRFHYSLDVS